MNNVTIILKRVVPLGVATLLLSGCVSGPPEPPVHTDVFATQIKDNDAKIFGFSMLTGPARDAASGGGQRPPRGDTGRKPSSGADNYAQKMTLLHNRVEQKLADTGYCRQGYIEIDTYETNKRIHLMGECNESATTADREQFPNK